MNRLRLYLCVLCTIFSLLSGCTTNTPQDTEISRKISKTGFSSSLNEQKNSEPNETLVKDGATSSSIARIQHSSNSLWPILTEQYKLSGRVSESALKNDITWFKRNGKFITSASQNSHRYLYYIAAELHKRNMPGEIALLPMIESNYRPTARGAGGHEGLWQFGRDTGKRMKLDYNWWYNGSFDVVSSTNAALDYIDILAKRYKGDYLLALAAYNCGSGTLDKIIQQNRKIDPHKNFWSLPLPKYTREHLGRLLALSHMMASPDKYGLKPVEIENRQYFTEVVLNEPIDMTALAHVTKTSLSEIQALNPGFLRSSTDPLKKRSVLIPANTEFRLQEKIAQLPSQERFSWPSYQSGNKEFLTALANKHGIAVSTLRDMNGLNAKTQTTSHQSLILPSSRIKIADIAAAKSQSIGKKASTGTTFHSVAPGESLWHIAQKYNTSVSKLMQLNQLKKNPVLKIGQKIRISQN